jgi:hypothetical protein
MKMGYPWWDIPPFLIVYQLTDLVDVFRQETRTDRSICLRKAVFLALNAPSDIYPRRSSTYFLCSVHTDGRIKYLRRSIGSTARSGIRHTSKALDIIARRSCFPTSSTEFSCALPLSGRSWDTYYSSTLWTGLVNREIQWLEPSESSSSLTTASLNSLDAT